jgi:hypothetical protein
MITSQCPQKLLIAKIAFYFSCLFLLRTFNILKRKSTFQDKSKKLEKNNCLFSIASMKRLIEQEKYRTKFSSQKGKIIIEEEKCTLPSLL